MPHLMSTVRRLYLADEKNREEAYTSRHTGDTIFDDDLKWAWLIGVSRITPICEPWLKRPASLTTVNTRSLSLPLDLGDPTDLYNHTLCPILDLANHSSNPSIQIPRPLQFASSPTARIPHADKRRRVGAAAHLVPGKIGFRLIAPERGMKEGDEVCFEYGGHGNAALWAEYGFVETGSRFAEVDLGEYIRPLWDGVDGGGAKEEVLRAIGCWGLVARR